MTVQCRKGDIFAVKLDDGRKRYFQFVCRDLEDLNSDVIRVFKKVFSPEEDPGAGIINEEIDFYVHTSVYAGVRFCLWRKSAHSNEVGSLEIIFRDSLDYGFRHDESKVQKVSKRWNVWKVNCERVFYEILPAEYHNAYIGLVCSPYTIAEIIKNQQTVIPKYYPRYQ